MIWKVLLYALAGYAALSAIVFILQRKMLYLPHGVSLSEEQASQADLRHWPALEGYRGFVGFEMADDAEGTIIVFHGNAGAAYDRSFYIEALSLPNYRVILAEYPGYGGRAGRPSEDVLVRDALETIRLAHQEYGEPLFLWGESLGSGVVAHAVRKTDIPIKGTVLFLPWDSLANLAQTHYWYLPARWLVRDRFDSVENLKGYEGNIAVVLAGRDEVVPVRHGKKLFESLTAHKKLWLFADARHNEMPVEAGLPWWQEVVTFISQ